MANPPRTKIHIGSDRAKRIFRELEALGRLQYEVAIKGTYQDGKRSISVATVAAYHEFGTSRMPARPFIRESQRSSNEVQRTLAAEVASIAHGNRRGATAARRVAKTMASLVVRSIDNASNWAVALAPSTIRKKGHSRPLIETSLLRNSVFWRVSRGGRPVQEGKSAK